MKFHLFLDREFTLKDRLYSFYWYGRSKSVSQNIHESLALEILKNLDLKTIFNKLRPRVPILLTLLVPIFLALVFLSLNIQYRPFGRVTKTVLRVMTTGQEALQGNKPTEIRLLDPAGNTEDKGPSRKELSKEGKEKGNSSGESREFLEAENGAKEIVDTDGSSTNENVSAVVSSIKGKLKGRITGGPILGKTGESEPISEKVSEPVPAPLMDEPSFNAGSFSEPEHLLNLLPWPTGRDYPDDINSYEPVLTFNLDRYSFRYRSHIERYFKELRKWKPDQ
jgi:hypothetical protein